MRIKKRGKSIQIELLYGEKYGFSIIEEVINGEDGLSPDLVITDIKMPKMDGLEMIKKAKNFGKNFEAILLTSYGEFEYAKKGIELKDFNELEEKTINFFPKIEKKVKN